MDNVTENVQKEFTFDTQIDYSFVFLVSAAEDAEQTGRDAFHESELFTVQTNE